MEPFEDDSLVTALESLRPAPRPAFAAELDERAAAGFPRRPSDDSPLRRLVDRLRAIEPRRALVPAGATALAAVAAVTVVVAVSENSSRTLLGLESEGTTSAPPPRPQSAHPEVTFGADLPAKAAALESAERLNSSEGTAASSANAAGVNAAGVVDQVRPFLRDLNRNTRFNALNAPHREIERSAQLVLGAESSEVRKAASEVFETVHAYRGIVLDSSIRDGAEGEAGARFSLLIPSAKLGDAMADFSAIGEVRSRREATADITAPTLRTGELLRDSRATIEGLLTQLAQADTDAERAATEAKLRAERRNSAYLRSQLSNLQRRANLSRVQLRIESGAASGSAASGDWGVGDALDDAGQILAIAAGVTIVGLAILGPIALIAFLAWLANRARLKRARHRALA